MPDPEDYQSTLDSLEQAMMQARGVNQSTETGMQPPAQTEVAPPPAPDKTPAYRSAALEDVPQISSLRQKMETAAKKAHVPVEYLEGIASRESRGGKALNSEGYDPVKNAYGVMQVDQRYHDLEGTTAPDSQEHIDQAAGILRDYKKQMDKKFSKWSEPEKWRAAIAAYNAGPGNIRTKERIDKGTTGGDYSQDVLIRAQTFKQRFSKKRR